jgi:hypothetical protein
MICVALNDRSRQNGTSETDSCVGSVARNCGNTHGVAESILYFGMYDHTSTAVCNVGMAPKEGWQVMRTGHCYIFGLASLLHTVFFTFVGLAYKNTYVSIGCIVIIAVFLGLFIAGVNDEIHTNTPIDNTYTKTVLGHDFLFAKFRWFGVDVIRVYSVYSNKYFYTTQSDVHGITEWIKRNP